MMYSGNSYHKDSLSIGQEYQDFIIEKLHLNTGITVATFSSKKYQFNKGETMQGFEIKYDSRSTGDCTYNEEITATGNVGIEVAEKSNPNNTNFIPSGIYRKDNTWMYVVGNYDCAWIFAKNILKELHKSSKYKEIQTLPTMKSFLLPIKTATRWAARTLIFNEEKMKNYLNG
jgi:hypothetical protein